MATFDQLAADQRAIIEIVLKQGRSYEQIGEMLDLPPARVRELAREALDELGRERRQFAKRLTRQLANAGRRKVEHLTNLLVAPPLPQDDLDDRSLVLRELVKG